MFWRLGTARLNTPSPNLSVDFLFSNLVSNDALYRAYYRRCVWMFLKRHKHTSSKNLPKPEECALGFSCRFFHNRFYSCCFAFLSLSLNHVLNMLYFSTKSSRMNS